MSSVDLSRLLSDVWDSASHWFQSENDGAQSHESSSATSGDFSMSWSLPIAKNALHASPELANGAVGALSTAPSAAAAGAGGAVLSKIALGTTIGLVAGLGDCDTEGGPPCKDHFDPRKVIEELENTLQGLSRELPMWLTGNESQKELDALLRFIASKYGIAFDPSRGSLDSMSTRAQSTGSGSGAPAGSSGSSIATRAADVSPAESDTPEKEFAHRFGLATHHSSPIANDGTSTSQAAMSGGVSLQNLRRDFEQRLAEVRQRLIEQASGVAGGLALLAIPLARPFNTQMSVLPRQVPGAAPLNILDRALFKVGTLANSVTSGLTAMRALPRGTTFDGHDEITFSPQKMIINGKVMGSALPINPGITILTPTRGAPDKLKGMIENIRAQTYNGAIKHVIMIDDCEKTRKFLEENYKNDPNISWFYYKREDPLLPISSRLSRLRNIGSHMSDTVLVASMDTDVRFKPEHFSNLISKMQASGAHLVYADRILCDEELSPIKERVVPWVRGNETPHEAYERRASEGRVKTDPENGNIILVDKLSQGYLDTSTFLTFTRIYRQYPIPPSGTSGTEDNWHALRLNEAARTNEISVEKIEAPTVFYPMGGYSNAPNK